MTSRRALTLCAGFHSKRSTVIAWQLFKWGFVSFCLNAICLCSRSTLVCIWNAWLSSQFFPVLVRCFVGAYFKWSFISWHLFQIYFFKILSFYSLQTQHFVTWSFFSSTFLSGAPFNPHTMPKTSKMMLKSNGLRPDPWLSPRLTWKHIQNVNSAFKLKTANRCFFFVLFVF